MSVFDVSLAVGPDMMVWPGDPPVVVQEASRIARGDPANVSTLRLGTHTGTHVDPPCHFIDGAATVDEIPPDVFVGPAVVLDLGAVDREIVPRDLVALPEGTERVLFRTRNSDLWARGERKFPDDYVALGLEGARWLVSRGVRLVGTDFLSIEKRGAPGHPVHVALLEAGVVIVEGLDLHAVDPGDYTFTCLPLRILDGDGGPARALLARA